VGDLKTVTSITPVSAEGGAVAGPAHAANKSNSKILKEKTRMIIFSPV
jgi:hypothetical protein